MDTTEEPRFRACYHRLCAAYQRKRDVNEYEVYLAALRPLSISAIEAAVMELIRSGGEWFPKTTKLFERAAAFEAEQEKLAHEERAALPPDPKLIERELPAIHHAKMKALEELERHGAHGVAKLLRGMPVRHPSLWKEPEPIPRSVHTRARQSTRKEIAARHSEMAPLLAAGKGAA